MNDDVGFVDNVRCCVYRLFSCTLVAKTTTNATLYEVLKWRCEVVVVLSHPDWNSSCPSVSTGVWVCGSTQRLHDPHASCAQLRHYQVPLQQAVPGLPQDSEGGVPAEHVAALRLRRPKIHDGWEQQLATTADPHTPSLELLTHSMGWGGGGAQDRYFDTWVPQTLLERLTLTVGQPGSLCPFFVLCCGCKS